VFNTYYQDELDFLRELGREFARDNPEIAHMLGEPGSDPDVERLLEGVAFLTGRIRQKLDDQFPELVHTLVGLLWPHYLRPIPSLTVVEFTPREQLTARTTIPRWTTEIDSVPVEGTRCRFRTCYDVEIAPLTVAAVRIESPPAAPTELHVELQATGRTPIAQLGIERLRFHLAGEIAATRSLFGWLARHTREVEVRVGKRTVAALPPSAVRATGFDDGQMLWPCPAHVFPGYRLLQEYFSFPAKFLFLDVTGLAPVAASGADRECTLIFRGARPPEATLRVSRDSLRLHCTPAVNLFSHSADPLRVDQRKTEYTIRPAGDPEHFEVYAVDEVIGLMRGTSERRRFLPFYSFQHGLTADRQGVYYHTRLAPALGRPNSDTTVAFLSSESANTAPPTETISMELTCTNRKLAEGLRTGDLSIATDSAPAFATFANIVGVTPSVVPPLSGDLHWRLISHLALNYLSIASVEALRETLRLYNVPALYDRQVARASELRLEGILQVRSTGTDRLVGGTPVRGTRVSVELREESFVGEGDLYLFGCVLDRFLALYATLNSFTQLQIRGRNSGETFEWPARVGSQPLI